MNQNHQIFASSLKIYFSIWNLRGKMRQRSGGSASKEIYLYFLTIYFSSSGNIS